MSSIKQLKYSYMIRLKAFLQRVFMKILVRKTIHPHRLVFVAGLPKSGTTWMENLIQLIPGYRRLVCYDPENRLSEHYLEPAIVENLPSFGNFFTKTHVEANKDGVDALKNNQVPTVVMVRDLRDQCVSRYHHVINDPLHRHHRKYLENTDGLAFSHCVEVTVNEYADWVRNWLAVVSENEHLFIIVRYEDLRSNPKEQFSRVIAHFNINISNQVIDEILTAVSRKANIGSDLSKRLRTNNNTFRAGRVGDWKDYFSQKDISYFKSTSNDTLISLGYELDSNW